MMKKMLAVALATMSVAGAASAQDMGMKKSQDPIQGVVPCKGTHSFEYVGGSLFGSDKSNPTAVEMSALGRGFDRATREFNGNNYVWVTIKGTTDSVGTEAYNEQLGMRRAEAVKKSLVDYGVKGDTIHMKSFGMRGPKYDNATAQGRYMNRAAHVTVASMDKEKADSCYANYPESVPKGPWWNLP